MIGAIGIVIAHITLTLCFSVMIFYSRFLGFRMSLVEAAMDLGASEARTFLEVILPLATPAILAVMLLTFTESFGEFIVAWFVAGFDETLPIAIWTSLRFGLSPRINAIATFIMIDFDHAERTRAVLDTAADARSLTGWLTMNQCRTSHRD